VAPRPSATEDDARGHGRAFRVALDVRYPADAFPGIGRYAVELARALSALPDAPELTLVRRATRAAPGRPPVPPAPGAGPAAHPSRVKVIETRAGARTAGEQVELFGAGRRHGVAVWHAPYFVFPYAVGVPVVASMFDAIPLQFPRTVPGPVGRRGAQWAARVAPRRARLVVTGTAAAGRDLCRSLGIDEERIRVVPLGVSEQFQPVRLPDQAGARRRLGLPERYLLHVGTPRPHKNVGRLLEAFAAYRRHSGDDVALVLAGRPDARHTLALSGLVERLGLSACVRMTGAVADADLAHLYACAELFVFPSLREGFGLPVLEAMASGTAIACSDDPALREVAGGAAVHFDPVDVGAMSSAIGAGLAERAGLARRGLARARRFSWSRTAEMTTEVYREACRRPPGGPSGGRSDRPAGDR
jgi:glycosyltransferase involved in cell wall biosynthesis